MKVRSYSSDFDQGRWNGGSGKCGGIDFEGTIGFGRTDGDGEVNGARFRDSIARSFRPFDGHGIVRIEIVVPADGIEFIGV